MPEMSRFAVRMCQSAPWRRFAGVVVLPWALQGITPRGEVLEIGAGSGAMAKQLLARHDDVTLTATDFDEAMVSVARDRLAKFADRAVVRQADALALPFPDSSFDIVLSWLMLHHTVEWEKALAEAVRVVRPGGHVIAYDLLGRGPMKLHGHGHGDGHGDGHGHDHRFIQLDELRRVVADLPVDDVAIKPSRGGVVVRFRMRKPTS